MKLRVVSFLSLALLVGQQAVAQSSVSGSGKVNFIPIWTSTTTIGNSILFQTGTRVGIGTTSPVSTLDVTGDAFIRGPLELPSNGLSNPVVGANSHPFDVSASSFNSSTGQPVNQLFRWQVEPLGNNTRSPSAKLSLLYASGGGNPAQTGLSVNSKGILTFAPGQTLPGYAKLTAANTFTAAQTVKGNLEVAGSGNGVVFSDGTKQTTAELAGPPGPQGPAGPRGPQGVQGAQGPQGPPGPGVPVVASVQLTNLTSDVPTTTIFTPTKNGLYRISVNMVVTAPGGSADWSFDLFWTDDAGAEEVVMDSIYSATVPPNAISSPPRIFSANASTPVTYQTTGTPLTEGSTYEVFFTIEQLQ